MPNLGGLVPHGLILVLLCRLPVSKCDPTSLKLPHGLRIWSDIRIGGVPYGWRVRDDGRLEPEPLEAKAVALAKRLRSEGASLRAVGADLDGAGFRPRTGKRWHVAVVSRMVAG